MNYQEMSDFEINKAVAIARGHKCFYGNGSFTNGLMGSSVVVKGNGIVGSVNFCKSWADVGPIAEENEIGVVKVLNGWCATNVHATREGFFFVGPNPRRAICIVFLMMKGGE